eukprot:scaffold56688_cov69-Cyclotella_meneghiniana.AAC.10
MHERSSHGWRHQVWNRTSSQPYVPLRKIISHYKMQQHLTSLTNARKTTRLSRKAGVESGDYLVKEGIPGNIEGKITVSWPDLKKESNSCKEKEHYSFNSLSIKLDCILLLLVGWGGGGLDTRNKRKRMEIEPEERKVRESGAGCILGNSGGT